ncbi:hypothetical protein EDB89DRAFT_270856 [Lactarius sanguifluus]|nr:hypothetical protein EDB89DRAFT_270856 [Lactarius sanguifluus]
MCPVLLCLVPSADELPDFDSALQKIDEVASNQDSQEEMVAEEALDNFKLDLRGPQNDQLDAYTDNLGEPTRYCRDSSSDSISSVPTSPSHPCFQARLVETEPRSLPNFSQSSLLRARRAVLLPVWTSNTPHFLETTSRPCYLVKFLPALPLPATHPSHLAPAAILSALKEAQRYYAEMRGNWAKKCLEVDPRARSMLLGAVSASR